MLSRAQSLYPGLVSELVEDGVRGGGEPLTLIVILDVSFMISAGIVSFADTHRIMCEVDIAVVA